MIARRARYQFGSVSRVPRKNGPDVWVYRYKDQSTGKYKSQQIGDASTIRNRTEAMKKAEPYRLQANPDQPGARGLTFGALVDRYVNEELPERHSTRHGYKSYLKNYIRPKWAEYRLTEVKIMAMEQWLTGLELAPKTKGHIRGVMRVLFDYAMRLELFTVGINPVSLVRVKGVSKRQRVPRILTVDEIHALVKAVDHEPTSTMILTAVCLGLSASEFSGLQWGDVNWLAGEVFIRRAVVSGRVDECKNEYREAPLPLSPELAEILLAWRGKSQFTAETDWVFANPYQAGEKPYNPWNVHHLRVRPAAAKLGFVYTGWHALRHTYSTMLRQLKVDVKVQQALMRHADIRTTMNAYTRAATEQMRSANAGIASQVLAERVM